MKTKEELAIEYCEYTVSKMDDETLRRIAVINLLANIDQETPIETWEDYIAQMNGLHKAEDLLGRLKLVAGENSEEYLELYEIINS